MLTASHLVSKLIALWNRHLPFVKQIPHPGNHKTGDYNVCKCVTQDPITNEDINNLHHLLRCFGWIFKICYHTTAVHYSWSEAKLDVSNHVSRALKFLKQAKLQIQAKVKEETTITLEKLDPTGHGSTSTTGNIAKFMQ